MTAPAVVHIAKDATSIIAEMAAAGVPANDIARELNSRGMTYSKGRFFTAQTVHIVIQSEGIAYVPVKYTKAWVVAGEPEPQTPDYSPENLEARD
jgi:hypothetical protein